MRRLPSTGLRAVALALALAAAVACPGAAAAQGTDPVPGSAGAQASAQPRDPAWVLDGARYREAAGRRAVVRYAPRDSLVALRVLALLDGQPPLPGLPEDVPGGVTAVLAHSPAAFDELTGGRVPEWRAGVAVPDLALLVVPTGEGTRVLDPEGQRVLRHEWAHLGLHQALDGLRIPRWFDEGYAQWASGGWDAGEAWRLRVLLALGRAPALDSLSLAWPRERAEAGSAYLLAASAVTFLLGESGERGMALFVERWRAQRSFDEAMRVTFGVTPSQFEEHWRRHVKRRYGWLLVASRSAVSWMVLALILLLMARVRRERNRERLARLRAAEVPDQPAFWVPGDDAAPESPGSDEPTNGVRGPT